jgi:hypothetical protein
MDFLQHGLSTKMCWVVGVTHTMYQYVPIHVATDVPVLTSMTSLNTRVCVTSILRELNEDCQTLMADSPLAIICLVCESICLARVRIECEENGTDITAQSSFW